MDTGLTCPIRIAGSQENGNYVPLTPLYSIVEQRSIYMLLMVMIIEKNRIQMAPDKFYCNNFYNPIVKEMSIFIFLNKR